jgi:hypothetical protein
VLALAWSVLGGCATHDGEADSAAAVDADGDGFPASLDCDDGEPAVHPAATEVCNDRDDDCDGLVDDADPGLVGGLSLHRDADGDGFGDASVQVTACAEHDGAVIDGSDCDDARASVHPGAPESCDGIDEDCNGFADDGCSDPVPGTLSLAAAPSWRGIVPDARTGASVTVGRDAATGTLHLALAAETYRGVDCATSRVYVHSAIPSGSEPADHDAEAIIEGWEDSGCVGEQVDLSGDGDDDGYVDLLLRYGDALVYRGPLAGTRAGEAVDLRVDPDDAATAAAWLGDIDGIPGDEIGLGQAYWWGGWETDYDPSGRASVYSGRGEGVVTEDDVLATIQNVNADFYFGLWIDGIGDLDGDGFDDFAVNGSHYFFGPVSGTVTTRDAEIQLHSSDSNTQITTKASRAGDLDGDGSNDAVVGARWDSSSGAGIVTRADLQAVWIRELGRRLETAYVHDYRNFGDGAVAGDFDGDGAVDIAIGGAGPGDRDGEEPAVAIEYGPFGGVRAIGGGATLTVPTESYIAGGLGQLAPGDFDDDGIDDLFIGTDPDTREDLGLAYIWLGISR